MDNLQEKVLFVGKIDVDLDLSEPPATGEEYIKRVILEARQCQDVVVKPVEKNISKQSVVIEAVPEIKDTPNYLMPTKEWQDIQIKDFSDVRLYIAEIKSRQDLQIAKKTSTELPQADDEKSWVKMCLGTEDPILQPKLNLVLRFSQPEIETILEHLINYIKIHQQISHNLGRWIYALLVLLELPLNPDTCSSLRLLARYCHKIRINLNSVESSEMNIYNLFICLVAKYFRQLDLADE